MRHFKSFITAIVMIITVTPAFSQGLYDDDYQLHKGYKCYFEFGYGLGVGQNRTDRIQMLTTHGYQFNPYLFAGIGIGGNDYIDFEKWSMPVFADLRGSLPIENSRLAPFVDFKIGYSLSDNIKGFFFSPMIGTRFGITEKTGVNLGFGYEVQVAKYSITYEELHLKDSFNMGALTFKLGLDF